MAQQLIEATRGLLKQASVAHADRVVYATSLGSQAMVLIDLICRYQADIRIVTLDTGRLPQETYDLMDALRQRYGPVLEVLFPDADEVRTMVNKHGVNFIHPSAAPVVRAPSAWARIRAQAAGGGKTKKRWQNAVCM